MIKPRQEAIKLAYDKLYKEQMGDKNFEAVRDLLPALRNMEEICLFINKSSMDSLLQVK